ncbi:MAG: ATP-dependent metallopeptidase FtsH/Yme1/Tma family protein [Candidatus Limnocylindrales bacterium]
MSLDGLVAAPGPLVVAATTRQPYELDPALIRAGRLGIHVRLDVPNEAERAALLGVLSHGRSLAPDVDFRPIAAGTDDATPADLRQLLDDALGIALSADRPVIAMADLLAAMHRGGEIAPPPRIPASWDRRSRAIHEAGHVAVAVALLGPAAVRRVEIDPSGGATEVRDPARPSGAIAADELRASIAIAYGGLAAERALLAAPTLASSDDLAKATNLLERLCSSGLVPSLPPLAVDELGGARSGPFRARYDDALVREADGALTIAGSIIAANRTPIERFADTLATVEQLEGDGLVGAIAAAGFRDAAGGPIVDRRATAAEAAA